MKIIDLVFSNGQTSADKTPVERRVLFTDDIAKILMENFEAAPQAQGTTEASPLIAYASHQSRVHH